MRRASSRVATVVQTAIRAGATRSSARRLEVVVIADESVVSGDLVVELSRDRVVVLGEPVEARGAAAPRLVGDGLDQQPGGALAARFRRRKEILQVAGGL